MSVFPIFSAFPAPCKLSGDGGALRSAAQIAVIYRQKPMTLKTTCLLADSSSASAPTLNIVPRPDD
jgi:hypothetical protein